MKMIRLFGTAKFVNLEFVAHLEIHSDEMKVSDGSNIFSISYHMSNGDVIYEDFGDNMEYWVKKDALLVEAFSVDPNLALINLSGAVDGLSMKIRDMPL